MVVALPKEGKMVENWRPFSLFFWYQVSRKDPFMLGGQGGVIPTGLQPEPYTPWTFCPVEATLLSRPPLLLTALPPLKYVALSKDYLIW